MARITVPSEELRASLDERRHPERAPSVRTEAQRDRDRILYSSAFLRLGHVTQVVAPQSGYTFHSRLTHSLKVAQVARGLAQRLITLNEQGDLDAASSALVECLDEDATEAAALAHDLGHPPFGHVAERVLQERTTSGAASFEGNPQSFRIVTRLARRSVDAPGLNLTRRTLNGLLKYPWLRADEPQKRADKWGAYDGDRDDFDWARQGCAGDERTLEAELMDWADDVTYAVHDVDDFYRAGLVPLDLLMSEVEETLRFKAYLRSKHEADGERLADACDRLFGGFVSSIRTPFRGRTEDRVHLRALGSALIGRYIAAVELHGADDGDTVTLAISRELQDEVQVLKALTWFYVIDRPSLAVIQRGQARMIGSLYDMYEEAARRDEHHTFPPEYAERVQVAKGTAQLRVVVDLIAGMTEANVAEIYRQQMGVASGSLLRTGSVS
jgi:dGTPase